jgi:hypothetical protein
MKKIISSAVALCLLLVPASSQAYNYFSYKWYGVGGLTYKWGSNLQGSSISRTAFEYAVSDWNATPTPVLLTNDATSQNTLNTENIQDSNLYGDCVVNYSGTSINYFTAMINVGNPNTSNTTIARSAGSHEIGHGLGLDHSTSPSIMNTGRDRSLTYKPQQDDITGINNRYSY